MTADAANLSLTVARFVSAGAFLYLAIGLVFALVLLLGGGLAKLDPVARSSSWGFRFLILPGVLALWPCLFLLLRRRASNGPGGGQAEEAT